MTANSFDAIGIALNSWMGDIATKLGAAWLDRSVADISMLGTHDSSSGHFSGFAYFDEYVANLAFYKRWGTNLTPARSIVPMILEAFAKTQNLELTDQLNNGVRFLDLRLGWKNEKVEMFHGSFSCFISFEQAIDKLNNFLEKNPSEFIIISIKIDNGDENKIRDWLKSKLSSQLFARFYSDQHIPTYREAKGKIIVLDRGVNALPAIEFNMGSSACDIGKNHVVQDLYNADSYSETDKHNAIKDFYQNCMNPQSSNYNSSYDGKMKLNFTSFSRSFERDFVGDIKLTDPKWISNLIWQYNNLKTPANYSAIFNYKAEELIDIEQMLHGIFVIDSFDIEQMRSMAKKLIVANVK